MAVVSEHLDEFVILSSEAPIPPDAQPPSNEVNMRRPIDLLHLSKRHPGAAAPPATLGAAIGSKREPRAMLAEHATPLAAAAAPAAAVASAAPAAAVPTVMPAPAVPTTAMAIELEPVDPALAPAADVDELPIGSRTRQVASHVGVQDLREVSLKMAQQPQLSVRETRLRTHAEHSPDEGELVAPTLVPVREVRASSRATDALEPAAKRAKHKEVRPGDRTSPRTQTTAGQDKGKSFIGQVIYKHFDGHGTFRGQVVGVRKFDTGLGYRVKYSDGDEEDLVRARTATRDDVRTRLTPRVHARPAALRAGRGRAPQMDQHKRTNLTDEDDLGGARWQPRRTRGRR